MPVTFDRFTLHDALAAEQNVNSIPDTHLPIRIVNITLASVPISRMSSWVGPASYVTRRRQKEQSSVIALQ